MQHFISVIGGHNPTRDAVKIAEEVGERIAKKGAVLVCGGLKGVMEAACKGAKKAGGLTIGILPGSRREEANPYVDVPIITGIGYARNKLVVKTGQVCIAIDGSYGTLSEIAFAIGYDIPVIGIKTWEFSIRGRKSRAVKSVKTAKEAVDLAIKIIRSGLPKVRQKREFKT